jgi:TRAP-type mannitol/chloroaromatic compound transport system substrate-binding protein
MAAAFKAAQEVFSALNVSNPHWKKIFADFSAYRADANLWFRFTEARFDSFMQAQKP